MGQKAKLQHMFRENYESELKVPGEGGGVKPNRTFHGRGMEN